MQNLINTTFKNNILHFTYEAYFNATEAAAVYGKTPYAWLRQEGTKEYIEALKVKLIQSNTFFPPFDEGVDFMVEGVAGEDGVAKRDIIDRAAQDVVDGKLIVTVRGGASPGTWLHPRLAVHFARWLDPKFAVWCDEQIHLLLVGNYQQAISNVEKLKADLATLHDRNKALSIELGDQTWLKCQAQRQLEEGKRDADRLATQNLALYLEMEAVPTKTPYDDIEPGWPDEAVYSPRFMNIVNKLSMNDGNYIIRLGQTLDKLRARVDKQVQRNNELVAMLRAAKTV